MSVKLRQIEVEEETALLLEARGMNQLRQSGRRDQSLDRFLGHH